MILLKIDKNFEVKIEHIAIPKGVKSVTFLRKMPIFSLILLFTSEITTNRKM